MKYNSTTSLDELFEGYTLTAKSEGKAQKTIIAVRTALRQLKAFCASAEVPFDLASLEPDTLRRFIIYLQEKPRYTNHPFTPVQPEKLSGHSVNAYVRGLQRLCAWLQRGVDTNN